MMANCGKQEVHDIVKVILDKNHKDFDINYVDFFMNHTAHGVCTLYSLGATKERIEEYLNVYKGKIRLDPLRIPKFKVDENNWEDYILDKKAYAELLPFFDEQVKSLGVEKCYEKFLPRLLPGFIGGAFHPLLQIGFGIEFNFPQVFAEGLAYACTYYNKIGEVINHLPPDDDQPSLEPLDIVKEMLSMNLKPAQDRAGAFPVDKIMEYYGDEVIQLVRKWKLNDHYVKSLEDIMNKLVELTRAIIIITFGSYRQKSLDFFLIHNLTSIHAIRILLPKLPFDEQKRLLQIGLIGLLGNMWLQGMPKFDLEKIMNYGGPIDRISWDSIIEEAITSNDEHVPKIIRALLVIKDQVPDSLISHELIQRSAVMTTDFMKSFKDWEFGGIGNPLLP